MNKKHNLFKELNINVPNTTSNGPLDINISNIKSKVNAHITSVSPERKVINMNFKKRISLIAAAAALTLGVTVFAASGIGTIWFGTSSANPQYHTLPTSKQVIKDVEYTPVLIDSFKNGYTFKEGTVANNKLKSDDGHVTDKFKSLSFCYEKNGDELTFSQIKVPSTLSSSGTIVSNINGIDLYYSNYIYKLVPNDSIRISNEETLLVTDIIVELEDGTIANIEMQKIGYLFPGQRSACYGADLLLRQYKRVRSAQKEKFSYKDIKDVYVIVFFENSTKEFHKFQDTYFHCFEQKSDTGLELELLEKFIFIPLDIFKENIQNKRKKNKLDAWLAFLSMDDPDEIISLITEYPEFKPLYQHIYDMCQNVERMMGMFSEELRIMDRNTVRYMIDQMQQELIENTKKLEKQDTKLQEQTRLLQEKDTEIQNLLNKLQKISQEN